MSMCAEYRNGTVSREEYIAEANRDEHDYEDEKREFKKGDILVNIIYPCNIVYFEKINPSNPDKICGTDEHGLYSENWPRWKYVTEEEWER